MTFGWFDTALAVQILPILLRATGISIVVTICSFCCALVIGLLLLLLRRSSSVITSRTTTFVVGFVRSTPLLVQIYFFFYVLPDVGIRFDPITTGIIAMSLHYGCYLSEVYRSAFEAIPSGQWDAATSLGYSNLDTFCFIILPQMIPRLIPPAGNFLVYMIKDSPLLASIGVAEVMFVAKDISQERFQYLEPITMCGVIFLFFSISCSTLLRFMELFVGRAWVTKERFRG
jgi:polar amino acid transport system permease protein